jgi:sulfate transport system permease protein
LGGKLLCGRRGKIAEHDDAKLIFRNPVIYQVFINSLIFLISVPLILAASLVVAVLVYEQVLGWRTFRFLFFIPNVLSPVIVGLSLVLLYGANGWFGFLPDNGVQILFATPAIVLATIFVSLPFVAREVIPTLREIGDDQEQAAVTLGASGWQTFWRITLPNVKWGLLYGVILCNARAMGEFGAVSVVSGHIRGLTNTLPLPPEKQLDKIEVLSVAPIIADALAAVFDDTSVSEIFGGENQA